MQGQRVRIGNRTILWLNIYCPTDSGNNNLDQLRDLLNDINVVLNEEQYSDVIYSGDFNWSQDRATASAVIFNDWLRNSGLTSVWDHHSIDYTYCHNIGSSKSVTDHFLVSDALLELIEVTQVVHRGDQQPGHDPIIMRMRIDIDKKPTKSRHQTRHPVWRKATPEQVSQYQDYMEDRLGNIKIPGCNNCSDPHCKSSVHIKEIEDMCLDITCCIIEGAHLTIPLSRQRHSHKRRKHLEKWSEEVEPSRKESLYWHHAWSCEGKPKEGWLAETMRMKRNIYHKAVRECRAKERREKAERLFTAGSEGNQNLVDELRAIKDKFKFNDVPDIIDEQTSEEDIANVFCKTYRQLYNSDSNHEGIAKLSDNIEEAVDNSTRNPFTEDLIKKAVRSMLPRKNDVSKSFCSESIILAPPRLHSMISALFNMMTNHGHMPKYLLACSFKPLPKGTKDTSKSVNFRAISGTNLLLKVFEKAVMIGLGDLLPDDTLQYGFKRRSSTTMCTWTVKEVTRMFLRNGTTPWIVGLDVSRAFDKCDWIKIFTMLLNYFPAILVRILLFSYIETVCWVSWEGAVMTSSHWEEGQVKESVSHLPCGLSIFIHSFRKPGRQE